MKSEEKKLKQNSLKNSRALNAQKCPKKVYFCAPPNESLAEKYQDYFHKASYNHFVFHCSNDMS